MKKGASAGEVVIRKIKNVKKLSPEKDEMKTIHLYLMKAKNFNRSAFLQ